MKSFLEPHYPFKECKKCPIKNKKQKSNAIISPCQNCIEQGKAVPPPTLHIEIENNK